MARSPAPATPAVSPNRAFVTVSKAAVQQIRGSSSPLSIEPGDSVDLQLDTGMSMAIGNVTSIGSEAAATTTATTTH